MELKSEDEEIIRSYLLKSLSPEEVEKVEYRLLSDGQYLEQVSLIEEVLTDEYVCNLLSPEERQAFEQSFLSAPSDIEELKLSTNLRRYALAQTLSRNTPAAMNEKESKFPQPFSFLNYLQSRFAMPKYVIACVLGILFLLAGGAAWQIWRLQKQIDAIQSRNFPPAPPDQELQKQLSEQQALNEQQATALQIEQTRRAELEQELTKLKNAPHTPPQTTLAALILFPGRIRGSSDTAQLRLTTGTIQAAFSLVLRRTDYDRYQAMLQDENGTQIWKSEPLKIQSAGQRKNLNFKVPANLLSSADYVVKLYGVTSQGEVKEADNYYFRVVKNQ